MYPSGKYMLRKEIRKLSIFGRVKESLRSGKAKVMLSKLSPDCSLRVPFCCRKILTKLIIDLIDFEQCICLFTAGHSVLAYEWLHHCSRLCPCT